MEKSQFYDDLKLGPREKLIRILDKEFPDIDSGDSPENDQARWFAAIDFFTRVASTKTPEKALEIVTSGQPFLADDSPTVIKYIADFDMEDEGPLRLSLRLHELAKRY